MDAGSVGAANAPVHVRALAHFRCWGSNRALYVAWRTYSARHRSSAKSRSVPVVLAQRGSVHRAARSR